MFNNNDLVNVYIVQSNTMLPKGVQKASDLSKKARVKNQPFHQVMNEVLEDMKREKGFKHDFFRAWEDSFRSLKNKKDINTEAILTKMTKKPMIIDYGSYNDYIYITGTNEFDDFLLRVRADEIEIKINKENKENKTMNENNTFETFVKLLFQEEQKTNPEEVADKTMAELAASLNNLKLKPEETQETQEVEQIEQQEEVKRENKIILTVSDEITTSFPSNIDLVEFWIRNRVILTIFDNGEKGNNFCSHYLPTGVTKRTKKANSELIISCLKMKDNFFNFRKKEAQEEELELAKIEGKVTFITLLNQFKIVENQF